MTPLPPTNAPPALRREQLRDALSASVDMLEHDRVDLIPAGFVDDYLALNWLEDRGTGLRLTSTGAAICQHFATRARVR